MRIACGCVAAVLLATASAAAEPAAPARDDDAWRLYHRAFTALSRGDTETTRALARELVAAHPSHPAAVEMAAVLSTIDGKPGDLVDELGNTPRRRPDEQPTSGARAELALFQTIHGIALGLELCIIADCVEGDGAGALALGLGGGVAGLVASLSLGKEVTTGQRALLNSGPVWGAYNVGLLLALAEAEDTKAIGLALIGGQAVGLGVGVALGKKRPTAGQVALANTVGMWAPLLTTGTLIAAEALDDDQAVFGALLLAADAGLAVGAGLAGKYPEVSRAQTLVIDAGGIVGGLAGFAFGVIASAGDPDSETTIAGLVTAGAAVGLGIAAYATRRWVAR